MRRSTGQDEHGDCHSRRLGLCFSFQGGWRRSRRQSRRTGLQAPRMLEGEREGREASDKSADQRRNTLLAAVDAENSGVLARAARGPADEELGLQAGSVARPSAAALLAESVEYAPDVS